MGTIDLGALRAALAPMVHEALGGCTHRELNEADLTTGLAVAAQEGTISQRIRSALDTASDDVLPEAAKKLLANFTISAANRNAVQDVLWQASNPPHIPKRTRREVARSFDTSTLVPDAERFLSLLGSLWVLGMEDLWGSTEPAGAPTREDVLKHVFWNPEDWSNEYIFDRIGAFEGSDRRFALFLEGLASADLLLDEEAQRFFVAAVNPVLGKIGLRLGETGMQEGYPTFTLEADSTRRQRRPKTLVFAAPTKPDIRLTDVVDNDIEVMGDPTSVLVYDRPIGSDGIRWRDLQDWWKESGNYSSDDDAKRALYKRLLSSLPKTSPPQRRLYELYHQLFSDAIPCLPALLPEVWLHWDPRSVQQRGAKALLVHRMDFLLLPPGGHRVVLEVDGQHHYATDGRPDPHAYARNMRADRELKLRGYDVYRFGAAELHDGAEAEDAAKSFFEEFFRRYRVDFR